MNNRLKIIRTHLNLSQEEFGSRIGIKSRAHISSLESGSRNITDRIIKDLVSVYNVNEEWLRTGEGDMFLVSDSLKSSNINKRIQMIRYEFGLTQKEFGDKIGLKPTAIGQMENADRNVTERTIILICSEFNVNSDWLRTGEGDMFLISDSVSLDSHAISCGLSSSDINVIKKFMSIYPSIKDILLDITINED